MDGDGVWVVLITYKGDMLTFKRICLRYLTLKPRPIFSTVILVSQSWSMAAPPCGFPHFTHPMSRTTFCLGNFYQRFERHIHFISNLLFAPYHPVSMIRIAWGRKFANRIAIKPNGKQKQEELVRPLLFNRSCKVQSKTFQKVPLVGLYPK